jgi:hypothetical protein
MTEVSEEWLDVMMVIFNDMNRKYRTSAQDVIRFSECLWETWRNH